MNDIERAYFKEDKDNLLPNVRKLSWIALDIRDSIPDNFKYYLGTYEINGKFTERDRTCLALFFAYLMNLKTKNEALVINDLEINYNTIYDFLRWDVKPLKLGNYKPHERFKENLIPLFKEVAGEDSKKWKEKLDEKTLVSALVNCKAGSIAIPSLIDIILFHNGKAPFFKEGKLYCSPDKKPIIKEETVITFELGPHDNKDKIVKYLRVKQKAKLLSFSEYVERRKK